ncbi:hypothetical protein R6Q57_007168 [Mikania cordata]
MHKIRGFRIRHKLRRIIQHQRVKNSSYKRLNRPRIRITDRAMTKLCGFARSLTKDIWFRKGGSSYIRVEEEKKNPVPKGHLAVYVGEKEDDAHRHRVLVPVFYFNHPLFGVLLREAEKVYGFNYDGGIHVPCRLSEFQNLQTQINADGSRPPRSWRLPL